MTSVSLAAARHAKAVRERLWNSKPKEPPPPPNSIPEIIPPEPIHVEPPRRLSVRAVLHVVSEYYGVGVADILGTSKRREIVRPRQVAMYIAHKHCGISVAQLGRIMSRDHTTILHGKEKVQKLVESDEIWRLSAQHIESRLLYAPDRS